jgi:hypothetical protein
MNLLIRLTTALAVATVAAVAAVISYRHAYELVSTHGETGITARLLPFTVDGLILAASMLILDANRRDQPVPPLARWCLGAGIAATIGANLAHGLGHGPIGALIRTDSQASAMPAPSEPMNYPRSNRRRRCTTRLTQAPKWRRRYAPSTTSATASAPSPATSASTAERSNASSIKRHSHKWQRAAAGLRDIWECRRCAVGEWRACLISSMPTSGSEANRGH